MVKLLERFKQLKSSLLTSCLLVSVLFFFENQTLESKEIKAKSRTSQFKKATKAPIVFESHSLYGAKEEGFLRLKGSVVVKQEDSTLYADQVEIWYSSQNEQIKLIVARGNAKIESYNLKTKIMTVLTGEEIEYNVLDKNILAKNNVTVHRSKDIFNCMKARYFLESGEIKAEKVSGFIFTSKNNKKLNQSSKELQ